ncbi:MAG: hypothetical protein N3G75_00185 [Methanothrix sp.]|nr:hypothetical protein [Methanothrix sp.]MCX8206238.1 hypothetical protein [Methanothrix sp.]
MEIWKILLICLLMLPAFFALNYLVVVYMARSRRDREIRVERFVGDSVGRDYRAHRFVTRRYRPRRR